MDINDSLDIFVDEVGDTNRAEKGRGFSCSQGEVPVKAVKLGLRLPSYLRRLESHSNAHDLCKARMTQQVVQDSTALIKASIIKARDLISRNLLKKAVNLLEKLINEGISHSDVFYLLGETYRQLSELSKAEEFLQRACLMKIHPPHCYFSLGKILQAKELYKESITQFQEYINRLDNPDGHYELGRSFMWLGYYEEAIEEFTCYVHMKRHLNLDPAVFVLRAEAFEAIDRLDLARKDYRSIIQINPNYYAPYLEHAEELAASGRFHEAKTIKEFVKSRTRFI